MHGFISNMNEVIAPVQKVLHNAVRFFLVMIACIFHVGETNVALLVVLTEIYPLELRRPYRNILLF